MVARQGGGLLFLDNTVYNVDSSEFMSATNYVENIKTFTISIYNQQTNTDEVSLTLLINPEDLTIGQSTIAANSYTRRGWVTNLWGKQQTTISGSGSTAGFYVQGEGLSNFSRRNSLGFINFQTLIALFKNNGYYFHTDQKDNTYFKDSSRVISVLDQIKIEYDGTSYVGSFSTFSYDDVAEMPYRMTYNIEYVSSGLKGDIFEGHERMNNNEILSNKINIGDQWPARTDLAESIRMSTDELNEHFYNDLLSSDTNLSDRVVTEYTGQFDTSTDSKGRNNNAYTVNNLQDKKSFNQLSESEQAAVQDFANKNNIPLETAKNLFTVESGGTWNGTVYSTYGHARGICQFTNVALKGMKSEIEKKMASGELTPKVSIYSIENVDDLISTFPTIEQQMILANIYTDVTKAPNGQSIKQLLADAKPEDKAAILTGGWFYPANMNKPDEALPEIVRQQNPGITNLRDYTNAVMRNGAKANTNKTATTTSGN
jgi:hypothetical protein